MILLGMLMPTEVWSVEIVDLRVVMTVVASGNMGLIWQFFMLCGVCSFLIRGKCRGLFWKFLHKVKN